MISIFIDCQYSVINAYAISCQKTSIDTMYSNSMQAQVQSTSMSRPTMMINAASPSSSNNPLGAPSMRPMVAQSPVQASMMVRPAGSPYAISNRAVVYEKNKRSAYSNDLRQQQIAQPGQSHAMVHPNVMSSHPAMMSGTVVSNAGPIRQCDTLISASTHNLFHVMNF
jgi:hypothetical protein